MGYGQGAGVEETVERPAGVTAIAGFQLLKAAILLLTGTLLRIKPELVTGSQSVLYPLLYVATRGRFEALQTALQGGNVLPGLLFGLGLYLGAIGIGLWVMSSWARRSLIFTSGLTLLVWAKGSLWPGPVETGASPDLTNFYVLLFLDAVVFLYLLRGNTAEMFEVRA